MQLLTKLADTWRVVKDLYIKLAGTWVQVRHKFVKVDGQWQIAYSRPLVELFAQGKLQEVQPITDYGVWYNRNQHLTGMVNRSWTLCLFDKNGLVFQQITYDIHADNTPVGEEAALLMAEKLNSLPDDQLFAILTYDEPQTNRMSSGLPAALYRVGATQAIIENIAYRGAYLLLGRVGRVPYFEKYIGEAIGDGDINAAVFVKFYIENGEPIIFDSSPDGIPPQPPPTGGGGGGGGEDPPPVQQQ